MWIVGNRSGAVIAILLAGVLMAVAGCGGENGEGQGVAPDPTESTAASSPAATEPGPIPTATADAPSRASTTTKAPTSTPTATPPAPTATKTPTPTPTAAPASTSDMEGLGFGGTVKAHQKISDLQGGFTGILDNEDRFGVSVANLGDLDGDGVVDLAVGAPLDDDGGNNPGAAWILFLDDDGSVKAHQKISNIQGGFTGILDNGDLFGFSVANLGDLDGDGVVDLAVGGLLNDDGGNDRGAVWILFLDDDGSVKAHQKISDIQGGFTGILDDGDRFGRSIASLGDLVGDDERALVVGAYRDDDGGTDRGAVWILFLNEEDDDD